MRLCKNLHNIMDSACLGRVRFDLNVMPTGQNNIPRCATLHLPRVSFKMDHYMCSPAVCATFSILAQEQHGLSVCSLLALYVQ